MPENIIPNPNVFVPEGGDSSTGDMSNAQVGTPKEGGVSPKDTSKKLPLLFMLLIPMLVIVAVISIYILLQARTMYQQTVIVPPTATPLTYADPTADWQTYTNMTHTFSFMYPSTLTKKDFSPTELLLSANDQIHEFRLNVFTKPFIKSIQVFVYDGGIGLNYGKTYQDHGSNNKITFKLVSEIDGIKIWQPSDNFPSGRGIYTRFIEFGDQVIWLSLEPYNNGGTAIPDQDQYISLFDQILSTFKFIDTATPIPSPSTSSLPKLTYSLPTGWTKLTDPTGEFEIAYDPSNTQLFEGGAEGLNLTRKSLNDNGIGYKSYLGVQLLPYNGGSKHTFIYQKMNSGDAPQKQDISDTYFEKEYSYNGKTCLFLNGIYLSQYPSIWGMCDAGGGQAFLITSYDPDPKVYLQTVQSIKLTQ